MRIVVKVGTSTLAHSTGRMNIRHVEDLVKVLSDLKNAGHEMILVSSGAIGMGVASIQTIKKYGIILQSLQSLIDSQTHQLQIIKENYIPCHLICTHSIRCGV